MWISTGLGFRANNWGHRGMRIHFFRVFWAFKDLCVAGFERIAGWFCKNGGLEAVGSSALETMLQGGLYGKLRILGFQGLMC